MEKMRQMTLLTVLAIVGVLVGGFMLLVKPKRDEAAAVRTKVAEQEATNGTLRNKIEMLTAQAKKLPKVQARLSEIQKKLPTNPALPSLIRALTVAAEDAGVQLMSLAPTLPVPVTEAVTAPAPATAGTSAAATSGAAAPAATAVPPVSSPATLAAVPVTLKVEGGYFQIEQFFNNIEDLSRAYLVNGFNIIPSNNDESSADTTLEVQLVGRVFMAVPAATTTTAPVANPAAPASK